MQFLAHVHDPSQCSVNRRMRGQDPISKYRQSKDDPLPPGFDHAAWRTKHFAFAAENVPKWAEAVKAQYGTDKTRLACVGYCFGAPFACTMLAGDLVSAGAFAHPSLLKDEHFRNLKSKIKPKPKRRAPVVTARLPPSFSPPPGAGSKCGTC